MTAARVHQTTATGHTVTSVAATIVNVVAGNCLIAGAGYFGTGTLSVADGVNTWSTDSDLPTASGWASRVSSAPSAAGGSTTVTLTATVAGDLDVNLMEYSGLTATAPKDRSSNSHVISNSTAYDSGAAATTTNAADLLLGFAYDVNSSTVTYTAGNDGQGDSYTLYQKSTNAASGQSTQSEDFIQTAATAAYKATATFSTSDKGDIHFVAYKTAAGAVADMPWDTPHTPQHQSVLAQ